MALKKSTGGFKKPYNGPRKGGFQKKEFDPTVVSAKDVMMARMNAITAVATHNAAVIAAGKSELAVDFDAEVERIFNDTLAAADHARVGSANKTAPTSINKSTVKKAEAAVADAFGDEEEDDAPEFDLDELRDLVLKGGQYAGNTLGDLYDDEDEGRDYLENYLAQDKNKNDFTRVRARAFLRLIEAA